MSQVFSEELVYTQATAAHGNYKYLRIVPLGNGQTPTLSATSTVQTTFELPNNVINLALSKLCFDILIPPQGAAAINQVYANALSLIDRVTLTTREGVVLADIPSTHIFGSLVSHVNTKSAELLNRNAPSIILSGIASDRSAAGNTTAYAAGLIVSQASPTSDVNRCNGSANIQMGGSVGVPLDATHATMTAFTPYIEPLILFTNATASYGNTVSYQINLSAFKDTILELNKNIYWGNNLVLNINWNAASKIGFTTTAVIDATHVTASAAFTTPPILNNLFLYTACETDPTIISELVSVVSNGNFNLMVPFVNYQKYVTNTATQATIQQRITRAQGVSLLRVYWGVYNITESDITTYNHNDASIVSYNTMMDGLRMQDFTLSPTDGTAWLYNERNFKDSCMLSIAQYRSSFVHIDNWSGNSICNNDDSILNGLSLDSDRTWSATATTANAAYRYYMYYTTQKKLTISRGAITLY